MKDITDPIELFKKIKDGDVVELQFVKKDGSHRLMKCTLNFKKIPKEKHPKNFKIEDILMKFKKNLITVFDLEKQDWRNIDIDTTQFIISNNERQNVRLSKKKM